MTLDRLLTIQDLRERATSRVPKSALDNLEGGAGKEESIARNCSAFADVRLNQFALRDVRVRTVSVTLFGRTYDHPIGIAPVGLCDLVWPGADVALARTAQEMNFPFVLSAAATTNIETVAKIAPDNLWFQLYVSTRDGIPRQNS